MAKDKLTDYSATNASNTDVGGINIDEGMLPSDVNNAIREVMTHLKEFESGTNGITKLSAIDAEITGTGAIKVPVGTTAQRPTPAQGQIRYNTTDGSFEGYDGSAWGAIGGGAENSFTVFEYTSTASQTTFSGADDNAATLAYTAGNIQVMLNGVVLDPSDYTATNGTSVVLASGAALNDVLNIYAFTSFSVADTVSASTGGTFSANVAVTGDLTVDTNTLYVDSTNNRVGIGNGSPVRTLDIATTTGGTIIHLTDDSTGHLATDGVDIQQEGTLFQILNREAGDIRLGTNGAERLRIDSSGNVGIGTTSPSHLLHTSGVGQTAKFESSNNAYQVELNYSNSTSRAFLGSFSNGLVFAPSSASEAMRIDSNGNVGIGVSSVVNPSNRTALQVSGGTQGGGIYFGTSTTDTENSRVVSDGSGGVYIATATTGGAPIAFYTANAERMRVDSSGNVLVGTTTTRTGSDSLSFEPANSLIWFQKNGTATQSQVVFQRDTTGTPAIVGSIQTSGTTTTYNTSSDYRLKENVTADWDATARLKQLNPVRFNFIADPDTTVDGFLAHEVQDIVPEAITGTKDEVDDDGNAVMQGIDQSKLVPLLVKTIQELEARIAALENA